MDKCEFAIGNILLTTATSIIEYHTSPTEKEGLKRVENRIKENKSIESVIDCIFDDSNCKCGS